MAILHFVRRRPDTFWLFIILMGGAIGALVYIVVQVVPDAGLLRGAFQVFPRRQRIREPEKADALFADVLQTSTLSETQYNYACLLAASDRAADAREWAGRILRKK